MERLGTLAFVQTAAQSPVAIVDAVTAQVIQELSQEGVDGASFDGVRGQGLRRATSPATSSRYWSTNGCLRQAANLDVLVGMEIKR